MKFIPSILIDFDGVMHSYKSGWHGVGKILDPPNDGAIEWITGLVNSSKFKICIYSARSRYWRGRRAMKKWLLKYDLKKEILDKIYFPKYKPGAWLTIDDRAFCYEGIFPTIEFIEDFKPHYAEKFVKKPLTIFDNEMPFIDKNGNKYCPEEIVFCDIDTPGPQFLGYVTFDSYKAYRCIDNWIKVRIRDDIDRTKIETREWDGGEIVKGVHIRNRT